MNLQRKHLGMLWPFTEAYLGKNEFSSNLDYILVPSHQEILVFDGYFAVILKLDTGMSDRVYVPKDKTKVGKIPHFSEPLDPKTVLNKVIPTWKKPYLHTDIKHLKQVSSWDLSKLTIPLDKDIHLSFKDSNWMQDKSIISLSNKGNPPTKDLFLPSPNIANLLNLCGDLGIGNIFKVFLFRYNLGDKEAVVLKMSNQIISVLFSAKFT